MHVPFAFDLIFASEYSPRQLFGLDAIMDYKVPIDQHLVDTFWVLMGFGIGGCIGDGVWIKDD